MDDWQDANVYELAVDQSIVIDIDIHRLTIFTYCAFMLTTTLSLVSLCRLGCNKKRVLVAVF